MKVTRNEAQIALGSLGGVVCVTGLPRGRVAVTFCHGSESVCLLMSEDECFQVGGAIVAHGVLNRDPLKEVDNESGT